MIVVNLDPVNMNDSLANQSEWLSKNEWKTHNVNSSLKTVLFGESE